MDGMLSFSSVVAPNQYDKDLYSEKLVADLQKCLQTQPVLHAVHFDGPSLQHLVLAGAGYAVF